MYCVVLYFGFSNIIRHTRSYLLFTFLLGFLTFLLQFIYLLWGPLNDIGSLEYKKVCIFRFSWYRRYLIICLLNCILNKLSDAGFVCVLKLLINCFNYKHVYSMISLQESRERVNICRYLQYTTPRANIYEGAIIHLNFRYRLVCSAVLWMIGGDINRR